MNRGWHAGNHRERKKKVCTGIGMILFQFLFIIKIISCERSWHLFVDDVQTESLHPKYSSPHANAIRKAWNLPINLKNLDEIAYRELEFDRAIDIVYKHQHPKDCSKVNYLISSGHRVGFSSEYHVEGFGLAVAMAMNRVYLASGHIHPQHRWQVPSAICGSARNAECYFKPWSSCTLEDANKLLSSNHGNITVISGNTSELSGKTISDHPDRVLIIDLKPSTPMNKHVPYQILALIEKNRIPSKVWHYYWRAISVAYLTTPNARTQRLFRDYSTPGLYNLTGPCISMYVRHGDKWKEMQLHNFTEYGNIAEIFWNTLPNINNMNNKEKKKPKKTIVLGTETPEVLNDVLQWGEMNQWDILYNPLLLHAFKANATGDGHLRHLPYVHREYTKLHSGNYEKFQGIESKLKEHKLGRQLGISKHFQLEYGSMIIDMADLLRCNAFVCTLKSNKCRMLDELRAMIAAVPSALYADLSRETCSNPPCYGDNRNFYNFSW